MCAKSSTDHTYLLTNKLTPSLPFLSRFDDKGTRVSEETIFINIYSVECTGYILQAFCNGSIEPAFHHLPMGPIWELGLRITCPTPSFAFGGTGFMVTQFWNGE